MPLRNLLRNRFLQSFTVIALCLALWACPSVSTLVNYIDLALQAAVAAAGATGNIPPAYANYVATGLGCIDFAAKEMQSADTDPIKSAKIAANCAGLTAPNLPPGTSANLIAFAGQLASRIADMLAGLPPATPPPASVGAAAPRTTKLSSGDLAKLKAIQQKAEEAMKHLPPAALSAPHSPASPALALRSLKAITLSGVVK